MRSFNKIERMIAIASPFAAIKQFHNNLLSSEQESFLDLLQTVSIQITSALVTINIYLLKRR